MTSSSSWITLGPASLKTSTISSEAELPSAMGSRPASHARCPPTGVELRPVDTSTPFAEPTKTTILGFHEIVRLGRNPFITAPASFLVKSYPARQSAHQTKPSLASIVPDQGVLHQLPNDGSACRNCVASLRRFVGLAVRVGKVFVADQAIRAAEDGEPNRSDIESNPSAFIASPHCRARPRDSARHRAFARQRHLPWRQQGRGFTGNGAGAGVTFKRRPNRAKRPGPANRHHLSCRPPVSRKCSIAAALSLLGKSLGGKPCGEISDLAA
jgi:hypothetical protein